MFKYPNNVIPIKIFEAKKASKQNVKTHTPREKQAAAPEQKGLARLPVGQAKHEEPPKPAIVKQYQDFIGSLSKKEAKTYHETFFKHLEQVDREQNPDKYASKEYQYSMSDFEKDLVKFKKAVGEQLKIDTEKRKHKFTSNLQKRIEGIRRKQELLQGIQQSSFDLADKLKDEHKLV